MSKQTLVLGAGCFWGVQYFFDQLNGVLQTEVGYAGGHVDNPSYEQVCYENSGHAEVCRVLFDDEKTSLLEIVKYFFMMHDPTQVNRQGPDVGEQYRSVIFYVDELSHQMIRNALVEMQKNTDGTIVTSVEKLITFWPAEDYHQKFTARTGRGACHVDPSEITLPA